ncbi:ABC transporter permease [Streptomyces sp. NPDC088097]|uniref:ABC transporter permease n=1 Tax=Streptomyces sp. NPDC088097 TaxID=3365823 RepID=UPI0037FA43FF
MVWRRCPPCCAAAERKAPSNLSEGLRPLLATALRIGALSWKEYRLGSVSAAGLTSIVMRAVFQVGFFTLLGRLVSGESGQGYAFVGAVAFAPVIAVVSRATAVVTSEIPQGTMYRLRLGNVPLLLVMVLRSWVYLAEGLLTALLALFLMGPAVLGYHETLAIAAALPVLALTTISGLCLGMFCCGLVLTGLDEGLTVNFAGYLILLCGGAVVPVDAEALRLASHLLPLGAGLPALRSGTTEELWEAAIHEAGVAVLWLLAAGLLLHFYVRRVRAGRTPERV